ncbi:MAG TPA: hypothetical protein VIN09_11365 [Chloroflexota bacterium]
MGVALPWIVERRGYAALPLRLLHVVVVAAATLALAYVLGDARIFGGSLLLWRIGLALSQATIR